MSINFVFLLFVCLADDGKKSVNRPTVNRRILFARMTMFRENSVRWTCANTWLAPKEAHGARFSSSKACCVYT